MNETKIPVKSDSRTEKVHTTVNGLRSDIVELNEELEKVMIAQTPWKEKMQQTIEFYKKSVLYAPKDGQTKQSSNLTANLLKVFADKNIQYTSQIPTIKVPTTGADESQRRAASIREKIVYGTYRDSGMASSQKKWAFDATVPSVAIAETRFNVKSRKVKVKRYDPRFCFWQRSNDNDRRVIAFWAVFPITKDECQQKYGVTPTQSIIDPTNIKVESLSRVDGKEWYLVAIRYDEKTRVAWVGDKYLEERHNHLEDGMPIDICEPFYEGDLENSAAFYLDPLIPLQAEYNDILRRRSAIVRRIGNPLIWARGIVAKQFDEIKRGLRSDGGGFVGLKAQGELGLLQVSDTKLLDEQGTAILNDMMRLSGFGPGAFGEAGGANTSGDALAMVFAPTQRVIDAQNIEWVAFYESINTKILRSYDKNLKTNEQVQLAALSPSTTIEGMTEDDEKPIVSRSAGFDITFGKDVIDGNYTTCAIPKPITPRDELSAKRLAIEAVQGGFMSRTTAYEEWGILSPEDELDLLKQEKQDPLLNAEGASSLLKATQPFMNGDTVPTGGETPDVRTD